MTKHFTLSLYQDGTNNDKVKDKPAVLNIESSRLIR